MKSILKSLSDDVEVLPDIRLLINLNKLLSENTKPIDTDTKEDLLDYLHKATCIHITKSVQDISINTEKEFKVEEQIVNALANFLHGTDKIQISEIKQKEIYTVLINSLSEISNQEKIRFSSNSIIQFQCSLLRSLTGFFYNTKSIILDDIRDLIVILKKYLFCERIGYGSWRLSFHSGELLDSLVVIKSIRRLFWSSSYCSLLFPVSAKSPSQNFILQSSKPEYNGPSFSLFHLLRNYENEKTFLCHCKVLSHLVDDSKIFLLNADDK